MINKTQSLSRGLTHDKEYTLSFAGKQYSHISYDDLVCLNYLINQSSKKPETVQKCFSTLSPNAKSFYSKVEKVFRFRSKRFTTSYRLHTPRIRSGVKSIAKRTFPKGIVQIQVATLLKKAEKSRSTSETYDAIMGKLSSVE